MEDGQSLLAHLQKNTELAQTEFTINSASYDELRAGFLAMVSSASESETVTSSKIKQVYFPVGGDYHLLSVLTPSGIVFDLRKRLDDLRFGDEVKEARDKKRREEYHEAGYKEIYQLTTIGYGGTKPQNISVLNNDNHGKAYLLLSVPPQLRKRDVHFPQTSFFQQSVRYRDCRQTFFSLHKLYKQDHNNRHVRAARDRFYLAVLDYIVTRMWQLRAVAAEQYSPDYHAISKAEQIWLLDSHEQTRQQEDDWLDTIEGSVVQFLFHGYEKVLGKQAIKLGDGEYDHMRKLIRQRREILR